MSPSTTSWIAAGASAILLLSSCSITEDPPPPADPVEEGSSAAPGQSGGDSDSDPPEPVEESLSQQGVSAGHPLAAEVGEQILDQGGNAVDAAVAMAFAVSVVEPYASGLGGGGSAIIAGAEGEPLFYDYREVVNQDGQIPDNGTGVPGFAAGMGQLHEDYGSLEWEQLLEPARALAADGFEVSEFLALRMSQPDGLNALSDLDHFAPGGEVLGAGEQLVQQDLGRTLERLAERGWEDFYTGALAENLAAEVDGVDSGSLQDYEVITTAPVTGSFGEHEVIGPPPSLPGAPTIQMLQIAEANGISELSPDSAEYVDILSQAWLEAEESVLTSLGDPNFVQVPVDEMIDPDRNSAVDLSASDGGPSAAGAQGSAGAESEDAPNTTHISVVDDDGLAVSMTNTIMYFWGSGQMVDGYLMNNHLSRFEAIDSSANQPDPGRRTVTWSNPLMVLDAEGRPELVIGSPGGHQILNILGTVLVQWGLQGRELEDAVRTPRFRAQEDVLFLESRHTQEQVSALEGLGWNTEIWPDEQASFGSVQLLQVDYDSGEVWSVDDPRREGAHRILE